MNTELLKEAVGYADGWKIHDSFVRPPFGLLQHVNSIKKECIAALASQLIEQVLAAGFDFSQEDQGSHFEAPGTWIVIHDPIKSERRRFELDGRDGRNENSITACVEFMRGRG